jgi:pimeloyl-ACP methyl ester carboxylesterase
MAWLVLLCGCASLPGARTKAVDGRAVEYVLSTQATQPPAVVFESGLGATMDWWRSVLPEISKDSTTFAYNRPGYGSSAATGTPRDGAHIVAELRALLQSEGVAPPYVLVGHSLGGLYMQLFARLHPQDVAALVLVDSTHPRQFEGEGALEKQSLWVRGVIGAMVTGTAKEELTLLSRTGEDTLKLPTLVGKPVFVLSAAEPMKETSDLARFTNEKRVDIARLYPGSKQIWVESGHAIPLEKPEAVVSAIRAAMAESRAQKR